MLSRRAALVAGLAAPFGAALGGAPLAAAVSQPVIRPRSDWAGRQQEPKGRLVPEPDVRLLIVHHTQTPNTERTPEAVARRLRSIFTFHTGTRRWPDVAYNFFVDPFGGIWEGRRGSLAGPVQPDATGGSQGFSQLACFVGDFSAVLPTDEAMDAMVALLAWLAARSGIPLDDEVSFVSRGSSKWRKGAEVTAARIVGHRDMSSTECPGDALYPLVASQLLPRARAVLAPPSPLPSPSPSPLPSPSPSAVVPAVHEAPDAGGLPVGSVLGGAAGAAAVAAGAAWLVRRSARQQQGDERDAAEEQGDRQPGDEPDEGG